MTRFNRRGLRPAVVPYDPNHVIQSLWIGSRLSAMENLCIRSFLANGHSFHLYVYGPCENVPSGAVVLDANSVIPEKSIQDGYHRVNSAFFSDMFRYILLQRSERWWVDMDTICLKPFDFKEEYVFASEVSQDGLGMMVDNGILKAPKDSELLRQSIARTLPTTFGPGMMTELTKELELRGFVKPISFFTPIMPWFIPDIFINPEKDFDLSGSHAVHLWNSSWKYTDKDGAYDPRCLYERLKRRYS